MTHNIFRIQNNASVMSGFYFIGFKEYILAENTSLDYTSLFFPKTQKNDKIIYKYFKSQCNQP